MKSFLLKSLFLFLFSTPLFAGQTTYETWLPISVLPSLTVTSSVQGRIIQINAKANQNVTAGAVLLVVADPILDEKLELLKNRYESAFKTYAKQEKLFKKNKIDYSEYLFARNQLDDAAAAYHIFAKKHDQTVMALQSVKINKVLVHAQQDIYYGLPLFEITVRDTYRLTAKLPFDYLKKLGINKKINLEDDQKNKFEGKIESLDIQGENFFIVVKIKSPLLKHNQKLKLILKV